MGPYHIQVEDDLLSPPDGGYPFIDWSDLSPHQRSLVLGKRVSWAMTKYDIHGLPDFLIQQMSHQFQMIGFDEDEDHVAATKDAAIRLIETVVRFREWEENKKRAPQPAHPKHLMAEGSVLVRVKNMIDRNQAYDRTVVFDEPVNAFTMLYGDRIAKPGDMLTACTTCDTERVEIKTPVHTKIQYEAKAVTI